ncbi:MAG: alpha/beta fold hydrolase, partial [Candidatus Neomicrothrix subdominans]
GPLLGIGHSMGGACLMAAELRRPGTIEAAFLFEPIIIPGAWERGPGQNPMADAARRRRPGFPTRLEALARYASRPPLNAFRADVLAAYVEHGFCEDVDGPDGAVLLCCTPEMEAQTFEAGGKPTIEAMVDVGCPVIVGHGTHDPMPGPGDFAPSVAAALPNGAARAYPHLGHFGPLQDPDTIADDALEFLLAHHT